MIEPELDTDVLPRRRPKARLAGLALVPLLFLLVILFYRKITLTNLILVDYDLLTYFYPYKEAAAAAFRQGVLPLWNPYLFTGAPFMANPQTALFYPLNLPGYALSAPVAVKYSIVFHVFLAGVFMFAFARLSLGVGKVGALAGSLCFMFGGFLTQQVGHINQLNAAVWLPLILLLFDLAWQREQPLFALLGGLALSVEIMAGHSQETFLLLVAFGLYAIFRVAPSADRRPAPNRKAIIWTVASFAAIVGLAAGLSAVQLLPTLELSRESIRGGGMTYKEATTFSLPPWMLARSLLPALSDSPFSEYIAYSGVIPLFLAALVFRGRKASPMAFFWLGVAILALLLALGGYDPLFALLFKLAPPLRLFRVPARWLYLYAFAMAALAGMGADRLMSVDMIRSRLRSLLSVLVWSAAAIIPVGVIQVAAMQVKDGVSAGVFLVWVGLILVAATLVHFLPLAGSRAIRGTVLLALVGGELFFAGSFLNSSTVTAPQAVSEMRPTVTQLLQDPTLFRVLSISRTEFDPGDIADLKAIFGQSLDKDAMYQLLVAIKHQEALSPNIPMEFGISTLDGYDGGVLPLRSYVDFKNLLLDGVPLQGSAALRPNQADALLQDQLAGVPNTALLGLLNVKYVIADKLSDVWVDNVYYDLSTPATLSPGSSTLTLQTPDFQATSLGIIYQLGGAGQPSGPLAGLTVRDRSGQTFQGTVTAEGARPLDQAGSYYVKLDFDKPYDPQSLDLRFLGSQGQLVVKGVSLIDGRTGASEPLTLNSHLRLVNSGDVKVYQNLDWQPRAFVAQQATWIKDDQQALDVMRNRLEATQAGAIIDGPLVLDGAPPPGFPAEQAPGSGPAGGQATIVDYQPESVLIRADMSGPGYLVLTDSYYPGWRAYVDGQETPVVRADYLFRAVHLPAGSHVVEFRYQPGSFHWGMIISLVTLALMVVAAAGWVWWWRKASEIV